MRATASSGLRACANGTEYALPSKRTRLCVLAVTGRTTSTSTGRTGSASMCVRSRGSRSAGRSRVTACSRTFAVPSRQRSARALRSARSRNFSPSKNEPRTYWIARSTLPFSLPRRTPHGRGSNAQIPANSENRGWNRIVPPARASTTLRRLS
jgi:hypothetical protein